MNRKLRSFVYAVAFSASCGLAGCGFFVPTGPGPVGTAPLDPEVIVVDGSGELLSRSYSFADFTEIGVCGFEVTIKQGDSFRVATIVDANVVDYLRVTREGSQLWVGLDPNNSYHLADVGGEILLASGATLDRAE